MLRDARQRFFAVGRLQQLIAVLLQPRNQNVAVGFVVVDHEDEGGIVHARLAIDDSVVARSGTGEAAAKRARNSLIFANN